MVPSVMTLLFLGSDGCFLSNFVGHCCTGTTAHVGTFTPGPAKTTKRPNACVPGHTQTTTQCSITTYHINKGEPTPQRDRGRHQHKRAWGLKTPKQTGKGVSQSQLYFFMDCLGVAPRAPLGTVARAPSAMFAHSHLVKLKQ